MDKKMANDGWVEHDGNGMPVDGNTVVLVKFRDASPYYWIEGLERPASSWHDEITAFSNWVHSDDDADIIAYRVIKGGNNA